MSAATGRLGGAVDPFAEAAARLAVYAPRIVALPREARLSREALQTPDFLLHEEGRLAIYYAPFDYLNPHARIVLVGITPGFRQMEIALRATRDALLAGEGDLAAICARVKYRASFAGPIRHYLLAMLDGIGLPAALGPLRRARRSPAHVGDRAPSRVRRRARLDRPRPERTAQPPLAPLSLGNVPARGARAP